ncbi:hypothetical protein HK102_000525 [Quaeritorhiza haematococci]|nr:hypothetical protein HK102_000525 [Quaeritorhiza haematococci]
MSIPSLTSEHMSDLSPTDDNDRFFVNSPAPRDLPLPLLPVPPSPICPPAPPLVDQVEEPAQSMGQVSGGDISQRDTRAVNAERLASIYSNAFRFRKHTSDSENNGMNDDEETTGDREIPRIHVRFANLGTRKCVGAPPWMLWREREDVLEGASGQFVGGRTTALVCPSKDAKNALLNLLMGNTSKSATTTGHLFVNGREVVNMRAYRKLMGRVSFGGKLNSEYEGDIGEDECSMTSTSGVMMPELTVRENILHGARCRAPGWWSGKDVNSYVDILMEAFSLDAVGSTGDEAQDNELTDEAAKQQRVPPALRKMYASIAAELTGLPLVLFVDEPTLGLEPSSFCTLFRSLQSLAINLNIAVVASITTSPCHLPSPKRGGACKDDGLLGCFDDVVLLDTSGRTMYEGISSGVRGFLEGQGHVFNPHFSEIDNVMNILRGFSVPQPHSTAESRTEQHSNEQQQQQNPVWADQRLEIDRQQVRHANASRKHFGQHDERDGTISANAFQSPEAQGQRARHGKGPESEYSIDKEREQSPQGGDDHDEGDGESNVASIGSPSSCDFSDVSEALNFDEEPADDNTEIDAKLPLDSKFPQHLRHHKSLQRWQSTRSEFSTPSRRFYRGYRDWHTRGLQRGHDGQLEEQSISSDSEMYSCAQNDEWMTLPSSSTMSRVSLQHDVDSAIETAEDAQQTDSPSEMQHDRSCTPESIENPFATPPRALTVQSFAPPVDRTALAPPPVTSAPASITSFTSNPSSSSLLVSSSPIGQFTRPSRFPPTPPASINTELDRDPSMEEESRSDVLFHDGLHRNIRQRGANVVAQGWWCFSRGLVKERRRALELFGEVVAGSVGGAVLGIFALRWNGEPFRGLYVEPFIALSPAPTHWFVPLYGLLFGIVIALVCAPFAATNFSEERITFCHERNAGHSSIAYFIAKTLTSFPRLALSALHLASIYYIIANPASHSSASSSFLAFYGMVVLFFLGVYSLSAAVSLLVVGEGEGGSSGVGGVRGGCAAKYGGDDNLGAGRKAVYACLSAAVACGYSPTLVEAAGWRMGFLWDISFSRWASEALLSETVYLYKDVFDINIVATKYGYTLGRLHFDLLMMLSICAGLHLLAFLLLLGLSRETGDPFWVALLLPYHKSRVLQEPFISTMEVREGWAGYPAIGEFSNDSEYPGTGTWRRRSWLTAYHSWRSAGSSGFRTLSLSRSISTFGRSLGRTLSRGRSLGRSLSRRRREHEPFPFTTTSSSTTPGSIPLDQWPPHGTQTSTGEHSADFHQRRERVPWMQHIEFLIKVDWKFVKTIFNVKPFFVPMTRRKVVLYTLYAVIAAALSGFQSLPSIWDLLVHVWNVNVLLLLIVYFLIDPISIIMCVVTCKYPPRPPRQTNPRENRKIALVITCHFSADLIQNTLKAALVHLRPQNIIVADNGNNASPGDDTRERVREVNRRIIYRYTNVGNKTLAQYLSVRYLMRHRPDIEYVMIIDDDVTLSPYLRFPVHKINDITKSIVYGIRGTDSAGTQNKIWTQWQDLEYKLTDFVKIFQDKYCSVLFPHGAISLWEKETLSMILGDHDAIFYADDVKMGMWLTRRGYRLAYYADEVVNTETPDTILGPLPNYYNQRIRSWDFAEHMLTWRHIKCFTQGHIQGKPHQTVLLKFFQLYSLYTNLMDWLKVPGTIYYIRQQPEFFNITFGIMLLINTLSILLWNYVSCRQRPDLKAGSGFVTIITFPIYKLISTLIRIIAMLRCFFVYWPRFRPKDCRPNLLTDRRIREIEEWIQQERKEREKRRARARHPPTPERDE